MIGPEPLSSGHDVTGFDCGVASLNDWLSRISQHAARVGSAKTHVIHDEGRVMGFYSLTASSVRRDGAPPRLGRAVAPLDEIPVLLLARLAVHVDLQGRGYGKAMLKFVFETTRRVADIVGVRALLVDAKDEQAERFYARYGIVRFPSAMTYPRRMYILISAIG